MKQLDHAKLEVAVMAVIEALSPPTCEEREECLQVLMHVTAAFLEGRSRGYVVSYFAKINEMLAGKFDR